MLLRLRQELRTVVERSLGAGVSAVALVDFPMHENIGDSAIWAGELATLSTIGAPVAHVCDVYGYRRERVERSLGPGDPILLHGGGNFGDVWQGFQAFRERVIRDFPDRQIVQLPQTVYYSSPGGLERTRAVLASHGGVKLLVRDEPSRRTAVEGLGAVAEACPDAAFALSAPSVPPPVRPVSWILRGDHERGDTGGVPSASGVAPTDWPDHWGFKLLRTAGRVHRRSTARVPLLAAPVERGLGSLYAEVARRRVELGFRMIATGEVLVSDRLHAHILACLLSMPNVVVDNSYGKLSSFLERWTGGSPLVHSAAGHAEGLDLAARLAGSPDRPVS
jgi:pyruvyl transferase EpsO